MPSWFPYVPFVLGALVAFRENAVAYRHLSPAGAARRGRAIWLGPLAGRAYFTPVGWRHRNRALAAALVGWLSGIALLVAR